MGVTTIFDFSTPSNYTFSNVGVSALAAKLLRNQVSAPLTKTSNFGTTSDYTYDNTKIQIAANQANLLDGGPTGGCTFFASMAVSANADFSGASGTATLIGGAAISGGYLNINGNGKAATYVGGANDTAIQTGCARFTIQPQYSGTPGDSQIFYGSDVSGTSQDLVQVLHKVDGNLSASVRDSSGSVISTILVPWNPTSGTVYEIEYNFDITVGHQYLFVNGVLIGSDTSTGSRNGSTSIIAVGLDFLNIAHNSQFLIKNLALFPSIQHTTGFTSPVALPTLHTYATTSPSIKFNGQSISDAELNAITNITASITASGSDTVTWSVSVNGAGSFLWWTGAVWATSSGVAQSNPLATIVANLATLPLATQFELQAFITSAIGTTTPTLANVVVTYNDLLYGTGTIQSNSGFTAQQIATFIASLSISGGDTVTFALSVNGVLMYWNGSAWTTSDGSFAKTNTAAIVNTNAPTLLTVNSTVKVFALLVSASGGTTPSLTSMTVSYNFGEIEPASPPTCIVTGFIRDILGNPVSGVSILFQLLNKNTNGYMEGSGHVLWQSQVTATTDANGYFEQAVLVSNFEGVNTMVQVSITQGQISQTVDGNKNKLVLIVPNQQSVDITTLLAA